MTTQDIDPVDEIAQNMWFAMLNSSYGGLTDHIAADDKMIASAKAAIKALCIRERQQAAKYQVWTGLIRTLNNGEKIYALRIAHQGKSVFGEVYRTEQGARDAVSSVIAELEANLQQPEGGQS